MYIETNQKRQEKRGLGWRNSNLLHKHKAVA